MPMSEPIAIVGIGCRFPGAADTAAFWQLVKHGVDAIAETPADRFDAARALTDASPGARGVETVCRRPGNGVHAVLDELPEGRGVGGAGKPAADAHDRDGLRPSRRVSGLDSETRGVNAPKGSGRQAQTIGRGPRLPEVDQVAANRTGQAPSENRAYKSASQPNCGGVKLERVCTSRFRQLGLGGLGGASRPP